MPRTACLPDHRAWLVLVALTSCLVVRLNAQQPELPPLANGADPNDWEAYYDAGVAVLHMDPRKADAAFAHASRIRPDRAEPLYARWIAFWALDLELFGKYIRGDEKTQRDPRVRQADSLRTRALWRNPFVHQGLILFLYDKLPGRFRDNAITRAWIALGQAELELALRRFGALIDRDPERYSYLRFVRASAFANSNQQDSATAELTALLTQLRAADSTELVNYYESKELLEHALGLLHLHARRVSPAQEAFGRAVAENAAFAPSHAMLGLMALAARDAETAEAEYGLAVAMDPGDVEHLIGQGRASRSAQRLNDAVEQFKKAVSMAPLYAAPQYLLGSALEASGDAPAAIAAYKQFLALAVRNDAQRADAQRKIRALGGSS